MGTTLKRTTIFLTPELHERLRCLAFEQRKSMAKLVREAILEILEDEEDIREVLKAREEGDEGWISLEELERKIDKLSGRE